MYLYMYALGMLNWDGWICPSLVALSLQHLVRGKNNNKADFWGVFTFVWLHESDIKVFAYNFHLLNVILHMSHVFEWKTFFPNELPTQNFAGLNTKLHVNDIDGWYRILNA